MGKRTVLSRSEGEPAQSAARRCPDLAAGTPRCPVDKIAIGNFVVFAVVNPEKVLTPQPVIQERLPVVLGIRGRADLEAGVGGRFRGARSSAVMLSVVAALA